MSIPIVFLLKTNKQTEINSSIFDDTLISGLFKLCSKLESKAVAELIFKGLLPLPVWCVSECHIYSSASFSVQEYNESRFKKHLCEIFFFWQNKGQMWSRSQWSKDGAAQYNIWKLPAATNVTSIPIELRTWRLLMISSWAADEMNYQFRPTSIRDNVDIGQMLVAMNHWRP